MAVLRRTLEQSFHLLGGGFSYSGNYGERIFLRTLMLQLEEHEDNILTLMSFLFLDILTASQYDPRI